MLSNENNLIWKYLAYYINKNKEAVKAKKIKLNIILLIKNQNCHLIIDKYQCLF